MTQPARFKQAELTRLIRGALAAGLEIKKIVIEPDGTLQLIIQQDPDEFEMGVELR